jgi:hypothetical protein
MLIPIFIPDNFLKKTDSSKRICPKGYMFCKGGITKIPFKSNYFDSTPFKWKLGTNGKYFKEFY